MMTCQMPESTDGTFIGTYFSDYSVFSYIPYHIQSLFHGIIDWLPANRFNWIYLFCI